MPKLQKLWLESRYNKLWNSFRDKKFTRDEAVSVLKELKDDGSTVNVILSELRKTDRLVSESDAQDARKSIYQLKGMLDTLKIDSKLLTRSDIESLLKKSADLIRTRVDYKFILILLFLKRISDKWEKEYDDAYNEALKSGLSEKEAKEEAEDSVYHDFDLPEEFLWESIRKDVNKLPERLSKALKTLAERNPELKNVVDSADFIQFTISTENSEVLRQLMELFSSQKLYHVSPDVLGDAYEWVLRYFAPQKAKEGEVYTPREVIRLLVEILDPRANSSVYDPACGSGGMLIEAYHHVNEKYGKKEAERLFLSGQEANPTTYALSRMNLFIHDIRDADVRLGDTLLYPKFVEHSTFQKFDIVIANPPWNQDGYDEEVLKKGDFYRDRFGQGFTPRQSADWAWIQHMLSSSKEKVGIVIDNGCLFRGGKEGSIRERALDFIDCVILLPEKLFYNTGAPGAVMIFDKNKPKERKGKVLFINASKEFEQHPDVRKLNRLGHENIEKVAKTYGAFKNVEGFSRVVSADEIKSNGCNLNVTLYVFPEEKEEEIDIESELKAISALEKNLSETNKKIAEYVKELK